MTGNKVLAFFSGLTVSSLVSGHHLAVQHDKRFDFGPEPVSLCYTYLSYYLAPLETPPYGYGGGSPVVTTITSIVQQTSLVPIFPTPILTTVPSGLPSLSPVLPTSASGLGPVPSPLPGPVEIILAIVPTVAGRMLKRDLGGFISDVGSPNPKDCRSATVYTLDSGRLLVASRPTFSIFADAGTSFTEFRSRESLTAGANIVDTTFLNDNGVLRWRNALFSGGEAGFCQVAATGQVYTTYVDSPTLFPAGCLPVTVSVIDPSQCHHFRPTTKHNVDRNSGWFHSECWTIFGLDFHDFGRAFFWRVQSEYYANFGLAFDIFGRAFFPVKPVASYSTILQYNRHSIICFAHHFGLRTVRELVWPRVFSVGLVQSRHIIEPVDRSALLGGSHVELV